MSDSSSFKPVRFWRLVAEELAQEKDPKRVLELSHELNQALEEQELSARSEGQNHE